MPKKTHGFSQSKDPFERKAFNAWVKIRQRCHNPKNNKYADYGGRGIKVHKEWHTDFQAFFDYVGLPPDLSLSINRIDNDGHYEPGNVEWATAKAQANNRRIVPNKGTKNGNGKLTDKQVATIRALLDQGVRGYKIAAMFSIHKSYVSFIKLGRARNSET